jgi:hypothetical protein
MSGSEKMAYEVAVIGMAGRFPKASTLDEFWRNLREGVEGVSFFSDAELEAAGVDRTSGETTQTDRYHPVGVRAKPCLTSASLCTDCFLTIKLLLLRPTLGLQMVTPR